MSLIEVKADVRVLSERIAAMADADINIKQELCDNVLPLFEGLVDALQEGLEADVADLEEAVDELMDASSDVLHPETAAKLVGTLEIGKQLMSEFESFLKKSKVDDLTKKRVIGLIGMYRQGAEICISTIQEITIPLDEVPPDDDANDPDDEGEGENDEPPDGNDDEDDIAADGGEG